MLRHAYFLFIARRYPRNNFFRTSVASIANDPLNNRETNIAITLYVLRKPQPELFCSRPFVHAHFSAKTGRKER